MTGWNTGNQVIHTPNGDYKPQSDDLKAELVNAAKHAGLESFRVKIDGVYVDNPEQLYTDSVAAINTSISVERYDTAG